MALQFLGIDPQTGLGIFRTDGGDTIKVDTASSPYAASLVAQSQAQRMPPNAPAGPFLGPAGSGGNPRVMRHGPAGTAQGTPMQNQPAVTPNRPAPLPSFIMPSGSGGNPRAMRHGPAGTAAGTARPANPTLVDPTTDPETPPEVLERERRMLAITRPNR
jgi:hypothetical protein